MLTPEQLADAAAMADETFQRWKSRPGHYRNLAGSHHRGKLGEIAVETWARRHGIDPLEALFRDPTREREADIRLRTTLADVKTWDHGGWQAWGRCVTPGQLPALRRKASVVVWCYVAVERERVEVVVAGWNSMDDIGAAPVSLTGPAYSPVSNHQLPIEDVRHLTLLLDLIGASS